MKRLLLIIIVLLIPLYIYGWGFSAVLKSRVPADSIIAGTIIDKIVDVNEGNACFAIVLDDYEVLDVDARIYYTCKIGQSVKLLKNYSEYGNYITYTFISPQK